MERRLVCSWGIEINNLKAYKNYSFKFYKWLQIILRELSQKQVKTSFKPLPIIIAITVYFGIFYKNMQLLFNIIPKFIVSIVLNYSCKFKLYHQNFNRIKWKRTHDWTKIKINSNDGWNWERFYFCIKINNW